MAQQNNQQPFKFPEFIPGATNTSIWSPEKQNTFDPPPAPKNPNNMSKLSASELEEIRRRYEAARSFEDDDEYLPLAIHGNTPTPGYALPVKRTAPPKPPPPKGPKNPHPPPLRKDPPPLKKASTDPSMLSKVNKPSMLRQQQVQEWETTAEKVVSAMAREGGPMLPGPDWEAYATDAQSDVGGGGASRRSSVATTKRGIEVSNPYAVHFPPLQKSLTADDDEEHDGVMHGHWDRSCV